MPVVLHSFRLKNPPARIPETAFPDPYIFTNTEHAIIDNVLALLNKSGLISHQSPGLLEQVGRVIEMEQRVAKGLTY